MAMTEDEKKEFRQTMAEGIADGLALFRSKNEEEQAKNPPVKEESKKEGNNNGEGPLDVAGFFLGRR